MYKYINDIIFSTRISINVNNIYCCNWDSNVMKSWLFAHDIDFSCYKHLKAFQTLYSNGISCVFVPNRMINPSIL